MVSRKCTCQLSSAHTLPIAAAMPPSAITVCALPSSDLQTSAVRAPSTDDSIAARMPAPPAPMTTTSWSCVSSSTPLEDPRIVEDARRGEPHVEVGEEDREEADPRPLHVPDVEAADRQPGLVPGARRRRAAEAVELPAHEVARGV